MLMHLVKALLETSEHDSDCAETLLQFTPSKVEIAHRRNISTW